MNDERVEIEIELDDDVYELVERAAKNRGMLIGEFIESVLEGNIEDYLDE